MTSAPRLGVVGLVFFRFTALFLAATHQPFVKRNARGHLYHPALLCASLVTSAATCCSVLRSVSMTASALRYDGSRSFSSWRMRATGSSPVNNGRVPSGAACSPTGLWPRRGGPTPPPPRSVGRPLGGGAPAPARRAPGGGAAPRQGSPPRTSRPSPAPARARASPRRPRPSPPPP